MHKLILLTTVKHSGTNSLRELLGAENVVLVHCSDEMWEGIGQWDSIATTFRDPLRVGASWANRGLMARHNHAIRRTWCRQWDNWAKIYPLATVYPVGEIPHRLNARSDDTGAHAALDNDNMSHYYKVVPKWAIDYALNLTAEVQRAKSVETHSNE